MTTSSKVTKLPNMHFRVWRVAINKCKNWKQAENFCKENGVPNNPIFLGSKNPQLIRPSK